MEQLELIQPRLEVLGYSIRKGFKPVWYLTNLNNGDLYALFQREGEWWINALSGSEHERQQLQQQVQAAIAVEEAPAIAPDADGGTMSSGEGNWIVVVQFPNLQSKIITRYRVRSDAEQHARKLERIMGNGYKVQAMFDLGEREKPGERQ